jgi:hypothetical protein
VEPDPPSPLLAGWKRLAFAFPVLSLPADEANAARYNFEHDPNVPAARKDRVSELVSAARSPEEVSVAFRRYHLERVVAAAEYADPLLNGPNLLRHVALQQHLVRVVWLSAPEFYRAARSLLPEAQGVGPHDWSTWLRHRLAGITKQGSEVPGPIDRKRYVDRLFNAWNDYAGKSRRPWWASFWRDIEGLLQRSDWANRLRDALGLGWIEGGHCLAVLRYEVARVYPPLRPTCLEANAGPWYFPSPSGKLGETGFTMDLCGATHAGKLLPEVLHLPMELDVESWTGHLDFTSSGCTTGLQPARKRHYGALEAQFGALGFPAPEP